MIDSMMNFGVSCGDLTSPQFIKNTEDKRPNTQNFLKTQKKRNMHSIWRISSENKLFLLEERR